MADEDEQPMMEAEEGVMDEQQDLQQLEGDVETAQAVAEGEEEEEEEGAEAEAEAEGEEGDAEVELEGAEDEAGEEDEAVEEPGEEAAEDGEGVEYGEEAEQPEDADGVEYAAEDGEAQEEYAGAEEGAEEGYAEEGADPYEHLEHAEEDAEPEANPYGEDSPEEAQEEEDPYAQHGAEAEEDPYAAYAEPAAEEEQASPGADGDIGMLMAEEREKHDNQLRMETRAREELEDMILRIEKHFKAEQAARKKAEELLQASIAAEMDAKNRLEDVMKKRAQEQRVLDDERDAIKRERTALESMRQEFDTELQAARSEVAKAQEALVGTEERIRSAEAVERQRLENDYQMRIAGVQSELDRTREEAAYRMMVVTDEMDKWRQQAQVTANAVLDAKTEVAERKRELDHTKDKMDRLLDKLLVGRERGLELSGAIASNQRMLNYMPGLMSAGMPGSLPQGPGAQGPWMVGANNKPASMHTKLPPISAENSPAGHSMRASVRSARKGRSADGGALSGGEDNASRGNYSHVKSKFQQGADEVGIKARKAKGNRKKPDRFQEAIKESQRNAMMARWN